LHSILPLCESGEKIGVGSSAAEELSASTECVESLDLLLTGENQSQANQPNSLTESPYVNLNTLRVYRHRYV
jgi:hypothetical protein